jgi:DUF971 family protein
MTKIRPSGVTVDKQKRLVIINWTDNHESTYPFHSLRAICPCAGCKGAYSDDIDHQRSDPDTDRRKDDLNLVSVNAVGAYALQFSWNDSHSAGIYSWDLLRGACACEICAAEKGQNETT